MKKTVKSLIIASSVAAIAGIGAVSFAKWQSSEPVAVEGNSLGKIDYVKLADIYSSTVTDILPYDQNIATKTDEYKSQTLGVTANKEGIQ